MVLFTDTINVGVATFEAPSYQARLAGTSSTVSIPASSATIEQLTYVTATVGDLVFLVAAGFKPILSVSGTASTGWVENIFLLTNNDYLYVYVGQVSVSSATDTLTIAYAAGAAAHDGLYIIGQFGATTSTLAQNAALNWVIVEFGGNAETAQTSFPWFIPASPGAFFYGFIGGYYVMTTPLTQAVPATAGWAEATVATTQSLVSLINPQWDAAVSAIPNGSTSGAANGNNISLLVAPYTTLPAVNTSTTYQLSAIPAGTSWVISHIGLTSPGAASAALALGASSSGTATVLLNSTVIASNLDVVAGVFSGPPYVTVRSSDLLTVVVAGVAPTTQIVLSIGYQPFSTAAIPATPDVY